MGGNGGQTTIDYAGRLVSNTAGLVAVANGGAGGDGGQIGTTGGKTAGGVAGSGAAGGSGGVASVTLDSSAAISITLPSPLDAAAFPYSGALTAIADGGNGGVGQAAESSSLNATAGNGGGGGGGGQASATLLGKVSFSGAADGATATHVIPGFAI